MTTDDGLPSIEAEDVHVVIDGTSIITGASILAPAGALTTVIGPNGSGKSTLLRTIYRACRPSAGVARIGGHDVWRLRAKDNGRARAVVTQYHGDTADFTVEEIVEMGRSPHKRYLEGTNDTDRDIVARALRTVGMEEFLHRHFQDLSGGERQRVLLARALAQNAPAILLDEPTNHLDVRAQLDLMNILRGLDTTILIALHDLNQALAYSDHVVVMSEGRVVDTGPPLDVITPTMLRKVFGVQAVIVDDPLTGAPHLILGSPQY